MKRCCNINLIYLALLLLVAPIFSLSESETNNADESLKDNAILILNNTVRFNGETFQILKFIENGEKRIVIKPVNSGLTPLAVQEKSKISTELKKRINEAPHERIPLTVTLVEQPLYKVSKKTMETYAPEIQEIKSQVQAIHTEARTRVLSKKSATQLAEIGITKEVETTVDIIANLSSAEKQKIIEENLKFEKTKEKLIHETIDATKNQIQPQQEKVKNKIIELGGTIQGEVTFYNVVFAKLTADKIGELSTLPEVDFVEETAVSKSNMDTSTYAINANTFWNNGYTGSPFEVGIADTGVDSSHPALSSRYLTGKDFVPNDCDGNDPDDFNGHGTHVAGTVASTDSTYKGVAYGTNILNLKIADCDINYSAYSSDVMVGVDWAIYNTTDAAEIISHSFAGEPSKSLFFDAVVDNLGVTVVVAAGNSGPDYETVTQYDYNAIVVGAMDNKATTNRADDIIASYSSRGPVPNTGRIKPDIMAPGSNIKSAAYDWEGGFLGINPNFVEKSGTSMATPHISGAAALLMSAGVYDPKEIKALFINTAEDYGTTGGDYDYGWGYVDLNHAYFHTADVRLGVVNASKTYLLYRGSAYSGDKTTLVWNRHANYSRASSPTNYYALSDLDLYMFEDPGGTVIYSASSDQNVEQVTSSVNADVVLKVDAYGFANGINSEIFAIATEEGFSLASPPKLKLNAITPHIIGSKKNFTITMNVSNAGEVSAQHTNVTLTLPSGFSIVSGSNPQDIGRIIAGSANVAVWTVTSPSSTNNYSLIAVANSSSYFEYFENITSSTIEVDATPPVINLVSPTPLNNSNLNRNWVYVTITTSENLDKAVLEWGGVNKSMEGGWYKNMTNLSDGVYIYKVWGNDSVGNLGASENRVVTIDTIPPILTILSPGNTTIPDSTPSVNVTFGEVVNAAWYRIDSGANSIIFRGISNLTFKPTKLSDGLHNITVWANDSAGNINSSTVWFTIDTTPPIILKISPPLITNNNTPRLNISFGETVAHAWYHLDDLLNSSLFADTPNLTLSMPVLSDGLHNVTVYANDSAGNLNYTTFYFIVDTIQPNINIVNTSPMELGVQANLTITITEIHPDTYVFYKEGSIFASGDYSNGTPLNLGIDTTHLAVWNYTLWSNDTAGNGNFSSILIKIQDTTPPTIKIQTPTNITYTKTILPLNFTVFDIGEVSSCRYEINNSSGQYQISIPNCQNTTLVGVTEGSNEIRVWANDTSNNWNVSSAVYFTIDTMPPSIDIGSPGNTTISDSTPLLNVTFGEVVNAAWYRIDSGANSIIFRGISNLTFKPTKLADGLHNITVWANDSAGNINSSMVWFTIDSAAPTIQKQSPLTITNNKTPLLNVSFGEIVKYTWYTVDDLLNGSFFVETQNLTLSMPVLSDGLHNVTVYANDSVGNLNYTTFYFTVDTIQPNIHIVNPSSVELGEEANFTINITEIHPERYIIYENGLVVKNWSYSNNVLFSIGINASQRIVWNYTIWANDTAGNGNFSSILITIQDTKPPVISDVKITPTIAKPNSIVTLIATISDPSMVYYAYVVGYSSSWDESFPQQNLSKMGSDWFLTFDVNASAGIYYFNITAVDSLNNTGTRYAANLIVNETSGATKSFTNTSVNVPNNQTRINATQVAGTILEVNTKYPVLNATVTLAKYTENPGSSNLGIPALNTYLEITSNSDLKTALSWVIIKMYYNESDIPAGYNESNLRMYYYAGNNTWTVYDGVSVGGVNTTENYVWANRTGFSIYGIFIKPSCFDGFQNQGETGVDCGGPCSACYSPPGNPAPSGPSGGGGGAPLVSTKSANKSNTNCSSNWLCSEWFPCINGTQIRTCSDITTCNVTSNKPVLNQSCIQLNEEQIEPNSTLQPTEKPVKPDSALTDTSNLTGTKLSKDFKTGLASLPVTERAKDFKAGVAFLPKALASIGLLAILIYIFKRGPSKIKSR